MENNAQDNQLIEKKKTHRAIGFLVVITIVLVAILVMEIVATFSALLKG